MLPIIQTLTPGPFKTDNLRHEPGNFVIWRQKMKVYEYFAEVLPDGHLSIPEDLRDKIRADSKIRVMLLIDDEETAWRNLSISQFLKGYSEKDALYDRL